MLLETSTVTQTKPVRIVIADDHPFLVDGFCFAMKKHPQVSMAGQAGNGEELIKLVEDECPDVVFTDIQMPVMDGITATREIVRRFPYVNVIAFTSFIEDCLITDMMEAGAMGYLLKNEHITIILRAIQKVMNRETYYSHEVSNRLVAMMKRTAYNPMKPFDKPRFTELELAVIKEICDELSSKEIATKLGVEVRSVESAKSRIMERTGCRNSAGIVKYAIRNYIVRL
jgi:two-component system, NarL family, response regulator NreC